MPISQNDMTDAEQRAVLRALAERQNEVELPRYDRSGDDWGLTPPITPGDLRQSRRGVPWAVFGDRCYRLMDTDVVRCVLDSDGRPLGVHDEGLLVLVTTDNVGLVAVVLDTGWNKTSEIIWS